MHEIISCRLDKLPEYPGTLLATVLAIYLASQLTKSMHKAKTL
jgi:hypothetical protein